LESRGMNKKKADRTVTSREKFVRGVYASMDEAIAARLHRLDLDEGLHPTCSEGCCHCCRFYILINMAEAHTLAQYIRREWAGEQINELRARTQQWHAWDSSRPGRRVPNKIDERIDLSHYEDCCPLLINGICSVYPVRPAVCRSHFVCASPLSCRALNDPGSAVETPVALASIVAAADSCCKAIRDHVEQAGWDYDRTLMLLPHWLAIEMGWDFGIMR
jgi:hypothetical protein